MLIKELREAIHREKLDVIFMRIKIVVKGVTLIIWI